MADISCVATSSLLHEHAAVVQHENMPRTAHQQSFTVTLRNRVLYIAYEREINKLNSLWSFALGSSGGMAVKMSGNDVTASKKMLGTELTPEMGSNQQCNRKLNK